MDRSPSCAAGLHGYPGSAPAIAALEGRADALYVCGDPLVSTNQVHINTLALNARLPTMHPIGEYVKAGGLISYGANIPDLWRRGGDYVDKILRGAKPGDLPVEQPTKFDLIINLKTAKALGLTVPPTLLPLANEVIEWDRLTSGNGTWRTCPDAPYRSALRGIAEAALIPLQVS